jgi:hypothetical protein
MLFKSDLLKTRYWSLTVIGKMKGETLISFYAAYFSQELCIPRDDMREVNGALKSIKLNPIYKGLQVAIKDGHFNANAEQLTGRFYLLNPK